MTGSGAGFPFKTAAGVAGARVLVHADEEGRGIIFEAGLGAVTVMNVEVDDRDFADAVLLLEIFCGDGDVGEEAESHGSIGFGVVARWPCR